MTFPRWLTLPGLMAGLLLIAGFVLVSSWSAPDGRTITYYVAADEVVWDYAPSGRDEITGRPFDAVASPFVEAGPYWTGRVARKSLYREYTDSGFATLKPRPPEWEHLGFLGPLLRGSVGDTIRVVFRNNTRFPASMHPHGVFYLKDSEGAPYADGAGEAAAGDDAVPPGGTHVYVWPVPARAGPAAGDRNSVFWMYHSHTHEAADVNAGLTGPMIITAAGEARPDGSPKNVDRELVIAFAEVDESQSLYLLENIRAYAQRPDSVQIDTVFGAPTVRRFGQYYFKETLNGFMYGNLPMPSIRTGERVRWYIMSSTNFEIHAPHWHGNTVELGHMRTDVAALLPMGMQVADMQADNPGIWLFHCHVANHLLMGMQGRYEVKGAVVAAK